MRAWPLAALLALGAAPAAAQVVIGGGTRPSVEVDLGAINGAGAPSAGVVPGYDRPLLVPPAALEAPKLKPPRRSTERKAPSGRKTAAKPPRPPEAKPEPPPEAEPKVAAPAPPPPPLAAPAAPASPPPTSTASAPPPFPPAPSAPVEALTSAPPAAPPPQAFSAAPSTASAPQAFAAAPPQALAPAAPKPQTAAPPAPSKPAPQAPTQMASLPPAGGDLVVEFQGESAELGRAASEQLRALAARLKDKDMRIQLKAYASGGADGASRAKRVSLSRGLAVRSYLIDQGMRSTQIDVRALGQVRDGGPEDRVDLVVLGQ